MTTSRNELQLQPGVTFDQQRWVFQKDGEDLLDLVDLLDAALVNVTTEQVDRVFDMSNLPELPPHLGRGPTI